MNDLEVQCRHVRKQADDAIKAGKDLLNSHKELNINLDDHQRESEDIKEQSQVAERRVNLMSGEIEELRGGLEQAERQRKQQ